MRIQDYQSKDLQNYRNTRSSLLSYNYRDHNGSAPRIIGDRNNTDRSLNTQISDLRTALHRRQSQDYGILQSEAESESSKASPSFSTKKLSMTNLARKSNDNRSYERELHYAALKS